MVPEAVASSKFDEAKAALERGAFDEALRLLDVAHAEDPDDAQTRELYAVTHLAKAIRLSEKARQARQAAIERRASPGAPTLAHPPPPRPRPPRQGESPARVALVNASGLPRAGSWVSGWC